MEQIEKLYRKNRGKYVNNVNRIAKNYSIAEEIVQEAFIKVVENYNQYDPEKGKLENWVWKIIFHTLWDTLRKKQIQICLYDIETFCDPCDYNRVVQNTESVKKTIRQVFNEQHRHILELVYLKGYKYEEVANMLNLSFTSVKSVCKRFKRAFKEV